MCSIPLSSPRKASPRMPPSSAPTATIGYVVTTWPRLSQTFILNEILALERRGQAVRIFSTKLPDGEPTHAKVTAVRAQVAYLAFRRCAPSLVLAHLRVARRRPGSYA